MEPPPDRYTATDPARLAKKVLDGPSPAGGGVSSGGGGVQAGNWN